MTKPTGWEEEPLTPFEKVLATLTVIFGVVGGAGMVTLLVGAALHNGAVFWPGFLACIVSFMLMIFTASLGDE
jgi:hypothetical protein